jgi:hypothetical protein
MISFDAYKRLSQVMQAEILLEFGIYLELTRSTPQLNIELYAVNDFYVEVYFEKETEDPLFLRAFYSIYELEPYLHLIEIDAIFETN